METSQEETQADAAIKSIWKKPLINGINRSNKLQNIKTQKNRQKKAYLEKIVPIKM